MPERHKIRHIFFEFRLRHGEGRGRRQITRSRLQHLIVDVEIAVAGKYLGGDVTHLEVVTQQSDAPPRFALAGFSLLLPEKADGQIRESTYRSRPRPDDCVT